MSARRTGQDLQRTTLFEMPSPFVGEPGVLSVREPAYTDPDALGAQLVAGEYGKPFLLEHDGVRALYFGSLRFQQSAMRVDAPYALDVAYTQGMMAFMLFNPRPRALTLLGLGGGSLAKFCHRHLPASSITAVEIDADVIAFRDAFGVPADDARFRIVCADAVEYVASTDERSDVVLVDLFDEHGVAAALAQSSFYADAARMLAGNGILVVNIAGDKRGYAAHVDLICAAFEDRVIAMSVRDDGNYLLFAFRNPDFSPRWKWMKSIARELQGRMALDFPQFAQLLERGQTLRLVQRMIA